MVFAVAIILLVLGTLAFHFLSPWFFTPIASNWETVDQTINLTFWVTGIVFVAVNLFMAYCVFRFRHRKGNTAHYEPENKKLEWWLTIVTSVGIAAMLAPGLSVWAKFVTPPKTASVVEVLGQQWNWSYRLPGKDGALGATDTRLVQGYINDSENPDETRKRLLDSIPLRRLATPEEIGRAVLFLASDHAAYITGTSLAVDGGLLAQA